MISYITYFLDSLPGVEVLASTSLLVVGGRPSQLEWEEYGLTLDIPNNALPPGFLTEIKVQVSVSGPYVYPNPESWKPVSAVYWISSSKDFINPIQLGIWHNIRGLKNSSVLQVVTAKDTIQNGTYIFENVSKKFILKDSFVYLNISHFSQYAVTSSKLNQTSFDGSLLYRKSPKGKFIWEYSLIVYKHQPDGIVERV